MSTVKVGCLFLWISLWAVAAEKTAIPLFNGQDLSGWVHYLWDSAAGKEDKTTPMSAVWQVENGVLVCQGKPSGYIRTVRDYENYRLTLEWRWPEGTTRANSGVMVHTSTPNAYLLWPKMIEVQLATGNAGDLWVAGTSLEVPDMERRRKSQGRRYVNLTDGSEKRPGEWNRVEILCKGDEIVVNVNGELVNHATRCSERKGAICLQSEGAPICFRNIYLTPLD